MTELRTELEIFKDVCNILSIKETPQALAAYVLDLRKNNARLTRVLGYACDYLKDIEGDPPRGHSTWQEWWNRLDSGEE